MQDLWICLKNSQNDLFLIYSQVLLAETDSQERLGIIIKMKPKNQGCGKNIMKMIGNISHIYKCQEGELCPKCKPKNQSPKDTPKVTEKEIAQHGALTSSSGILSDKIITKKEQMGLPMIYVADIKDFIQKLKHLFVCSTGINYKTQEEATAVTEYRGLILKHIDKLAGIDLI